MSDDILGPSFFAYTNSEEEKEQQYDNQKFIQSVYEQLSDGESDSSKKTNNFTIQVESLEQALKKYEAEIGFKAIKFRMECENTRIIIQRYFICENSKERQSKKKFVDTDHRDRESKKLVENNNHSLAPYQKEFAPSLCALSQKVLDEIKFLTQECGLGAKEQYR
ncbi:7038_t:CDS:2, partial [Gigaspora margarita]